MLLQAPFQAAQVSAKQALRAAVQRTLLYYCGSRPQLAVLPALAGGPQPVPLAALRGGLQRHARAAAAQPARGPARRSGSGGRLPARQVRRLEACWALLAAGCSKLRGVRLLLRSAPALPHIRASALAINPSAPLAGLAPHSLAPAAPHSLPRAAPATNPGAACAAAQGRPRARVRGRAPDDLRRRLRGGAGGEGAHDHGLWSAVP